MGKVIGFAIMAGSEGVDLSRCRRARRDACLGVVQIGTFLRPAHNRHLRNLYPAHALYQRAFAGDRPLDRGANYCRNKAADYDRQAQQATDEAVRAFLHMMKDQWLLAAEGFEKVEVTREGVTRKDPL